MTEKSAKDISISIPAAIATLPLPLNEKVALAHILKYPGCSNGGLARLLGISERGAEALLHRLRKLGHIEAFGKGRARWHQLTFAVEPPTECGNSTPVESHTNSGDENSSTPTTAASGEGNASLAVVRRTEVDVIGMYITLYEMKMEAGLARDALKFMGMAIESLKASKEHSPEDKEELLAKMTPVENYALAVTLFLDTIESKRVSISRQWELKRAIQNATPQQLALIRQRVDGSKALGNALEVLALPST